MSQAKTSGIQIARILVVEHEPHDADMIERALRRAKIANPITVVEDGPAALDILYSYCGGKGGDSGFGMVLLDLDLPGSGGLELLETLGTDRRLRDVPVIVLTGSRQYDLLALYKSGALAVLTKPIEVDRLLHAAEGLRGYRLFITVSSELTQRAVPHPDSIGASQAASRHS